MPSQGPTLPSRLENSLIYLDDYLDTLESLPSELQRNFTLMRQLDASSTESMDNVSKRAFHLLEHLNDLSKEERAEELKKLGKTLNDNNKHGAEKVSLANSTYNTVDRHIRRLDDDLHKFEDEQMTGPESSSPSTTRKHKEKGEKTEKAEKSHRNDKKSQNGSEQSTGKTAVSRNTGEKEREKPNKSSRKKDSSKSSKSKASEKTDDSQAAADMPIDPNEPIYCYCQQVSWGEMVACDNNECEIEWFHYPCVSLKAPPKGKWYCPDCTEKLKIRHKR
ncbi:7834_t:CDS:2 [Entrophospora sp. SA101]|nr:9657_t:CDS:2 [Entrophospora candida]CAH1764686.1 14240_t:CDS:2 [Entrophospora sp. SA101]CAJ0627660.1 15739_t:CDS:2 [Entrophospora sp. SA101]CAJ0752177.1 7834_t:CDS:2 [Entrophospora sp. SA101]CAJ0828935.1 3222_t:CDS:2 [Entrophospora sp. SA101]